jgi:hypothetical protein
MYIRLKDLHCISYILDYIIKQQSQEPKFIPENQKLTSPSLIAFQRPSFYTT